MAQLQFLPWVSAGPAATVPRKATGVNRVPLDVTVAVTSTAGTPAPSSAAPLLSLLGPGDVTGVPAAHVVRTEPQDGATGVETTIFPCVEFDHAALPWLFTAAAPAGAQVAPWLCLIVVASQDGVQLDTAAGRLTISPPADPAKELPDLAEAWAWAHAQYAGDLPADKGTGSVSGASAAVAMADPAAALSRLVCPRVLKKGTSYYGCVVPVTSVGQVAGLGGAPADNAPVEYAWPAPDAAQTVTLPVYHSFQFSTGGAGDFKSLAAMLAHPPDVALPAAGPLGQRSLRVSWADPGGGNPASETVAMPAILSVPAPSAQAARQPPPLASFATPQRPAGPPAPGPGHPPPPPGPGGPPPQVPEAVYPTAGSWLTAQFTPDLAAPRLTAPLYGAVQAGVTTAQAAAHAGLPSWLTDVSADPRLRVAAGLGAQVVTAGREDLVASAFDQLGAIEPVNAQFARAQLARAAGDRHVARHLTGHDDLSTLQLLSPLAARLPVPASAVAAGWAQAAAGSAYSIVAASGGSEPSLPAVCSAAYRRISRPRGPHARAVPPAAVPPASPIPAAALLAPLGGAVAGRVRSDYVTPPTLTYATGYDPLHALAPAVQFRTPMIGPLIAHAPDAVLAGAGTIPVNTALTLQDNPDVIAAYMIGLNDQVQRLLQWRDVPTDRTATPFRWFWSASDHAAMTPLAGWGQGSLASQLGLPNVVLAVRGDLFTRYPRTAVYAVASGPRFPVPPSAGQIIPPTFTAILPPDLRLFVFTTISVTDRAQLANLFFVFQEQVSETRFGTGTLAPGPPSGGSHWSVTDVQTCLPKASNGTAPVIGDAAQMAKSTRMLPCLVAINAAALLPAGPAASGAAA